MFSAAFHTGVYEPLYNGLIFLIDVVPYHDVGIAVVLLTIAARILLFPVKQAVKTQAAMRAVAPEIERLKEKYKDKQEEQARAIFALYREKDPPILKLPLNRSPTPDPFGLYWVFWRGGLPQVDVSLLYSFVEPPTQVNMLFLGAIDVSERSVLLAFFAGITQLVYARLSMGARKSHAGPATFSSDLARSMDLQMRYVFPIMIGGLAYTVSAAVPLYWVTSNTFMIVQEYVSGRRLKESSETT